VRFSGPGLDSHKIWSAAKGLALQTLPKERAGEVYEEATRGRSASHHLQVKGALQAGGELPGSLKVQGGAASLVSGFPRQNGSESIKVTLRMCLENS
ncbi:MAG: hypothetical protein WBX20_08620, partial [Terrimicrobiaceae bacterium]